MSKEGVENIKNLLDKIFIFDEEYKGKILNKAAGLDEAKLLQIHDLLFEVESWQRTLLEKKLQDNPGLFQKLSNLSLEKNAILSQLNNDLHEGKDREKISKVLSFIDKL